MCPHVSVSRDVMALSRPIPTVDSLFRERDGGRTCSEKASGVVKSLNFIRTQIHARNNVRLLEPDEHGKRGYDVRVHWLNMMFLSPSSDMPLILEALNDEVESRGEAVTVDTSRDEWGTIFTFTFRES